MGKPSSKKRGRLPLLAGVALAAIVAAAAIYFLGPFGKESAHLTLLTTPSGASVSLDGEEIGPTPIVEHLLPEGSGGSLEVSLEGYETLSHQLTGEGSQQLELRLEPLAVQEPDQPATPDEPEQDSEPEPDRVLLTIGSRPAGATVSAGDEVIGTTPLQHGVERSDEEMELTFRKPGFRPTRRTVGLSEDGSVDAVLRRVVRRQEPEEDPLDIKLGR
ncbi:MAG: PEGA domain-containing protein [Myxococcota bacterium]